MIIKETCYLNCCCGIQTAIENAFYQKKKQKNTHTHTHTHEYKFVQL